ncbi:putative fasciclin-like arabinogalactan protein 20 [Mercurialis annua]|uniref:putative fasciclin-like arabinogalactan protein 20 n=1 Tax=Mercurialis annua TaxID=3986 RepID=UPI0021605E65|nr:putative fasciclin-like arabinogalactan protein 20 [Mercurialis annua]
MAPTQTLTLILLSLIFFTTTHSIPTSTILQAAEILSKENYLSMSLTLHLISATPIIPHSPSLTIFSPSDSAFAVSGQPSLALLQFHFCPLSFPLKSIKSLPFGSEIPTLSSSNLSITVTSDPNGSAAHLSLNGVKIVRCLYNDGSLVILGVEKFLDPDFIVSLPTPTYPPASSPGPVPAQRLNLGCGFDVKRNGFCLFKEATNVLRSNGYSVMASFLDLQLMGFQEKGEKDPVFLTVFAPLDEVMKGFVGDVNQYASVFLRHVVPCKISWKELGSSNDGVVFDTFMKGFGISVSRSGDILMLNEVPVSFPDMYQNDRIVVHGLRGLLDAESSSYRSLNDDDF